MIESEAPSSEYFSYLNLHRLLEAQHPRSDEHDENLFIITHQVHELWFKQLLIEFGHLRQLLTRGATTGSLSTVRRVLLIFSILISPTGMLGTLTPQQFARFREKLGTGSGFQSAQFREIEAALGRRDPRMYNYFPAGSAERARIERAIEQPTLFDSLLMYLAQQGYSVPVGLLTRDVRNTLAPSPALRETLLEVYLEEGSAAQMCEGFLEIDQSVQEWRYRHVVLAERLIGQKAGTGGTTGASYLRRTLLHPVFPDLWATRTLL